MDFSLFLYFLLALCPSNFDTNDQNFEISTHPRPVPAFIAAASQGNISEVKLLIARGENVNLVDDYGIGALHVAAEKGHLDVIKLLINSGAEIDIKDIAGNTPVFCASNIGDYRIAKFLCDSGAIVDTQGSDGNSPLNVASSMGYINITRVLIRNGANVNAALWNGVTPIHQATSYAVTELLLEAGADPNLADSNGSTPLHFRAKWPVHYRRFPDVRNAPVPKLDITNDIVLLCRLGAIVNATDKEGQTPLHSAVIADNIDAVGILLEQSADPQMKDISGKTPLDIAEDRGNKKIARIIRAFLRRQKD